MSHVPKLVRKLLPASVILAALPIAAHAADFAPEPVDTNSTAIWAGVAFQDEAFAAHAGGVWAANGDLDSSGFLFRGQIIYVDFDFDTDGGDDGDGEIARGNASVGYQFAGDGVALSLFAGVDVQEVDIDPDDDTDLDDEVGLILTARLATNGATDVPMSLEGNYSTANDMYWARARVGYRFDQFALGPEFAVLGNTGFDAYRIGGYAQVSFDPVIFELNAGYHDGDADGGNGGGYDGLYGGATVVFVF